MLVVWWSTRLWDQRRDYFEGGIHLYIVRDLGVGQSRGLAPSKHDNDGKLQIRGVIAQNACCPSVGESRVYDEL